MTSNVYCGYSGSNWELNSSGQDACQVYAQLQGQCNSSFVISPVTSSSLPYTPPNNACGCNVVAYNLMAGCAWCQNNILNGWWLSEAQWEATCTTYNPSGLPNTLSMIGINIPSWAFQIPTGTAWNPAEASSAAAPNGFTPSTTGRWATYTYTDNSYDNHGEGTAIGRAFSVAMIVSIILWCLIGLSILCCIAGCIAHCQRQTRRKRLYGPMNAYYLAQNAGLYYGPYRANANPGTFGSAAPLLHPNQPQPPPSAHLSYQGFSPLRTSFIRSPQPPPAEMTQLGSAPLVRAEPVVAMPTSGMNAVPYSPVTRGGLGEASGSGRGAGSEVGDEAGEVANVERTKSVSCGGHAASFYGAHMATAMEGNHGVEETPQSLLPYAGGQGETLTESKAKQKAP